MKRPVQISDVAKLAGVSQSSVSRALNPDRYASEALRARVMEAAQRLGYEPNSFAQNLRSQSSKTIACMVSDFANPMYAEIIGAAEARLQEAGYLLVVANSHGGLREIELLTMFRRRRMDGLMITIDTETSDAVNAALRSAEVPLVLLDRDVGVPCDRVTVDHQRGAHVVITYLLNLGHRHILLETPSALIRPGRERIAGARAAVQDAGLPASTLLVREHLEPIQSAVFSNVLNEMSKPSRPTAVVTLGTEMLAGALAAIEASHLRIPADVSVVSIGDTSLAQFAAPGITALRWDLRQFGRSAAELLLGRVEGGADEGERRTVTFSTELVIRQSCARPRTAPDPVEAGPSPAPVRTAPAKAPATPARKRAGTVAAAAAPAVARARARPGGKSGGH